VASLQQTGVGSFHMTLNWNAYRQFNATAGLTVFVHFVNDSLITASSEGIVFQGDHLPASPATQWIPGQMIADGPFTVEVPSSLPDGTYSIRVGLYDPATQVRMAVSGQQDANLRVLVGYVTVQGGGMSIRFSAPASVAADPRLNASDGVANFPTVQTDGMISITQENGQWVLRPFPRTRNFTVAISAAKIPQPPTVEAMGTTPVAIASVKKGDYWVLPLNGSKSYSWPVQ
jgi:hypothetical protein